MLTMECMRSVSQHNTGPIMLVFGHLSDFEFLIRVIPHEQLTQDDEKQLINNLV